MSDVIAFGSAVNAPGNPKLPTGVRTSLLAVFLATTFPGGASVAAGDAAPPPAEVFGALPATTNVVITPSGQRLAWIDQRFDKPRVVMFDVAARKELRIIAAPELLRVRSIFWNDDDTLIIRFSETQEPWAAASTTREYFINIAYDARGGEGRLLPATRGSNKDARAAAAAYIVRSRVTKPHTVIMATATCHGGIGCLMEVDTNTGEQTVIKSGNAHSIGWLVNRDGLPLAREDWDWKDRAYYVYALSGENIREILRNNDSQAPTLAGVLFDSPALVLLKANEQGHQAAWALPLDGRPLSPLIADPDADITGVYTDANSGMIVGAYLGGVKPHVRWLDPEARHRSEVLERAFPGKLVDIVGWSANGSLTLAEVQSGSSPPMYYLVDFATHRADIAGESYPALENVPLGELQEISYKARDGTTIPAYLTLPPAKRSGAGPLVVLPHGGPNSRDYPGFNWLTQFLATRGYAVLQPQFRGSSGFGEPFQKAGYRQWGGLMQDDLTDGVQAMIAQGVADSHHVAIVGFEYGGYAALAGAAFTPTLYSCAASVYGISDLQALQDEQAAGAYYGRVVSASQSRFAERIGAETDPALRTRSPINSIATIRIPILIAYGTAWGAVPNRHSERMIKALTSAGKPVTVVNLAQDGMASGPARTQLLQALESFLKDHL